MKTMIIPAAKIPLPGDPKLPFKGFPEGRYRIRWRGDDFPKMFIRTANGLRVFIPKVQDGHWMPMMEIAANTRGTIS
jgi:hypothetical protein